MSSKKYFILVLITCIKCSSSVSLKKQNNTANMLWNPPKFVILSRQNLKYQQHLHSNIIPQEHYDQRYPVYAKPFSYGHITNNPYKKPNPNLYYSDPHYPQSAGQNIMEVLYSIARNDDLKCVPKIVCALTSGTMYGRQNGERFPIEINLESFMGFLSLLNGLESSPFLYFGKAALLGYTSKGNSRVCDYQYPECPSDHDKLVQYLNNHNGGFFRYFNGINPQNYAPLYQHFYPNHPPPPFFRPQYSRKKYIADKRIQNTPVTYISSNSIGQNKGFLFPEDDSYNKPSFTRYLRPSNNLKFPENMIETIRTPKKISFFNQNINFEKPLPNHKASAFIFPDRTGTGEFLIDSEYLDKDAVSVDNKKTEYHSYDINNIRNYYFNLNKFRNGKNLHFPDR